MNLKIIALVLAGAIGGAHALSPVETHGALTVKNGKLTDKSGKPVTLRGMSFYWSSEDEGGAFYNASCVKWLVNDWKVSVLRAAIGVEKISEASDYYLKGGQTMVTMDAKIDAVVNAAVEMGIYVIIDWHAHQLHQSEANAFFEKMAKKYGHLPNVLWETFNEPNGPSWSQLLPYHNTLIATIRKYSKSLIIVGNPEWSSRPAESGNVTDATGNVGYAIHAYTSQHQYLPRVDDAIKMGRYVFATEWGSTSADGASNYNWSSAKSWLDGLESRGVSHCNWDIGTQQLDPSQTTSTVVQASAALQKTARPTGTWATTDLTQSGKDMRNYLRTINAAYTVPEPPAPTYALTADTVKAGLFSEGTGVIGVASTDGLSYNMLNATAGGTATYKIIPNNTGKYLYNIRIKAASGGKITFTANGVPARVFNVPASSNWTTVSDTMELPVANVTIPLKLEFSAAMSVGYIKFVRKILTIGVSDRPNLKGQVTLRPTAQGLIADLGTSHKWTSAYVVDVRGRSMWQSKVSPEASSMAIPAPSGMSWLLLDGHDQQGVLALPPVR